MSYFNEYYVFDTFYDIFRDLFFGKQLPNPYPYCIYRLELKALQFQAFEVKKKDVM